MRVLLVTWTEQLLQKLSILNPALEYCAIVVDDVEAAQKSFEKAGRSTDLLRPLYDLPECLRDFHYDYVLCVENGWWQIELVEEAKRCGAPPDKLLNFCSLNDVCNFLFERALRYFEEHAAEFEMIATGISYTEKCLDVTRFKRKLFNFGRGSQDLYYNLKTAERVVACGKNLRYALIGLAAYIFHYDHSKASKYQFMLWQYLIAFGDMHNFRVPVDVCKKFFHEKYLTAKISTEPMDLNNPFYAKFPMQSMKPQSQPDARPKNGGLLKRDYPATRDENIKILDDYLTLCEEHHIRPIMFLPPSTETYKKHSNGQRLDEFHYLVGQAQKKHPSAIFLDGWKLKGLTNGDFYDYGHLNLQGAAKFSAFLNKFIESIEARKI